MKLFSRSGLLAAAFTILFISKTLVLAEEQKTEKRWDVEAQFIGRIVGMTLDYERIPTLRIGYDSRFQMKVEVITLEQGKLPTEGSDYLGFLIHSPTLFFGQNIGRKPDHDKQYIEGPFRFKLLSHQLEGHQKTFELSISEIPIDPAKPNK